MKIRSIYMLVILTGLGLSALLYLRPDSPDSLAEKPPVISKPIDDVAPEPIVEKVQEPIPIAVVPLKKPEKKAQPVAVVPPPVPKPKPAAPAPLSAEEQQRIAINRYYDHMERNFDRQLNQLNGEMDPARRLNLIQALARHVRVDTLAALDWAASLENRKEQRAALEAINKNALTGIGARIEMDERGVPKIKETTILSAVESTGMVQPGDYISGMVNSDGTTVSFKGMNIQQIVKHLHGQPGSQIQLRMERTPEYGSTQPIPFDVPVQRSLIVVQRPSDG